MSNCGNGVYAKGRKRYLLFTVENVYDTKKYKWSNLLIKADYEWVTS